MKISTKFLVFSTISLGMLCLVLTYGLFSRTATAQIGDDANVITHMTGGSDAVWIATEDQRLIYCWFQTSAARPDTQANCRVMDRFRVNVMR